MANIAIVNGQEYSFVDLKATFLGIEIFSLKDITAKETQEKTNNYGNGTYPVSRGRGKKETEFSCSLGLKDRERLQALSITGLLTDLPIGTLTLLLDNGINKHKFTLVAFEFGSDGIEMSDGDTESRMTITGVFGQLISEKIQ